MQKEILINAGPAELRVAVIEDGRLQELSLERLLGGGANSLRRAGARSSSSLIGNIVLGRVQRVLPGMQAAFVDIGLGRAGFLGAREARSLAGVPGADADHAPRIGDCVREGEEIVVQVVKDPIGDKGARLSASVTIPGRLLVLAPNHGRVAVSRRVEDEAERARLTGLCEDVVAGANGALPPGAGYIVRSAAVGATLADLREDAERLAEIWRPVLDRRKLARAPALLHRDLDAIARTLRDEVDPQTVRVLLDDPEAFRAARAYCRRVMPAAEEKLELFAGPEPLFEAYGVEEEIERLVLPRAPLPCGGWITVETTEALTAIDVNSGSYTAAGGLEETSLKVNLEAAWELGRQLRLRGIGGVVVVDFIHLQEIANRERLLAALGESLARDRTPTQVSPISEFGLVEITRKRVRDPIGKLVTETCHLCRGRGRQRTRETVALEILREVERAAAAAPGKAVIARAAPEVVGWLLENEAEVRSGLNRRGAPRVLFEAREEFTREGYDVSTV